MDLPHISVDILIIRDGKILLGLMTDKWLYKDEQVYGAPGREIHFREKIGDTVKRNIKEELGCKVLNYKFIAVNANYALGNHYIGIGVIANIKGQPQITMPEDWQQWEWFDKDNLPPNLFPATKNLIDSYLQDKISVAE